RIDCDISATGRKIRSFEDLIPCFAAIGGFIETAVGRIAPERAGYSGKDRLAVLWVHGNLCNALGLFQTGMRPCFAAVGRFVDPVANRNAVARPRFSSSD